MYPGGKELELLIVDVNESHHGYDSIEVEWSSDFAVMLRAMIDVCDKEQLDKICRNNFKFNK